MKNKKQAEPEVIYRGVVSDASEHLPMLDNPYANRLADEVAIREAVESGTFTEEEARALMSGSSEPLLEHIRNRDSETARKDAKTFLDGLRAHLDKNIHPENVRRWLQEKERDEQYEEVFLDKFVLPPIHEYLCNSLTPIDASKAFLTESRAARLRGISSGTPASAKRHPFTKEFSINKKTVVQLWWPRAKTDARVALPQQGRPSLRVAPTSLSEIPASTRWFLRPSFFGREELKRRRQHLSAQYTNAFTISDCLRSQNPRHTPHGIMIMPVCWPTTHLRIAPS